jgi:hypothetical protein
VLFIEALGKVIFLPSVVLGKIKHSAMLAFWHSANPALGKRWLGSHGGHLPSNFAECLTVGTRQIFYFFKIYFAECHHIDTRQNFFF